MADRRRRRRRASQDDDESGSGSDTARPGSPAAKPRSRDPEPVEVVAARTLPKTDAASECVSVSDGVTATHCWVSRAHWAASTQLFLSDLWIVFPQTEKFQPSYYCGVFCLASSGKLGHATPPPRVCHVQITSHTNHDPTPTKRKLLLTWCSSDRLSSEDCTLHCFLTRR